MGFNISEPEERVLRLRISGIEPESIVDGPGIRMTIFVQGCPHRCPHCHNPQTHDFNGGHFLPIQEILEMIEENDILDGITFSGGEPFSQAEELVPLAREIKERGYNLVIYTGYLYEDLLASSSKIPAYLELLSFADILVDGPFIYAERTLDKPFKGSANQRVIDVQKSLSEGRVVLFSQNDEK